MDDDLFTFLEEQTRNIKAERERLGKGQDDQPKDSKHDGDSKGVIVDGCDEKENVPVVTPYTTNDQTVPSIEPLDLSSVASEASEQPPAVYPIIFRSSDETCGRRGMLRYGEYSPNNPQLRVNAAPYIGLGEYEARKRLLLDRRKELVNTRNERIKVGDGLVNPYRLPPAGYHKSAQTDIQNIDIDLIQYTPTNPKPNTAEGDLLLRPPTIETCNSVMHNNRSPVLHRLDQRITAAHNSLLKSEMDKPRGILTNRRTESPRERIYSDLKHSYVPPNSLLDGFSYSDRSEDLERERIKREIYQNELRLQIEEKRRYAALREEQERREQELENRRLEQQLLRMQEEQFRDEQRRKSREQMRRNSDDYASRKQELQSRYRKHLDSEGSLSNLRGPAGCVMPAASSSSKLSHYSPPVSRRNPPPYSFNAPSGAAAYGGEQPSSRYNPSRYDSFLRKDTLNRMDSLNVPTDSYNMLNYGRNNSFSRYDSLSRIDSLKQQEALSRLEALTISDSLSRVQRRHSATQQDLSATRRSPKLQRRSSSSRFDDSLPVPVLKARSPVARELKNSIAVATSTRHTSDALRRLEDKWQIPAVQKNIINHGDHGNGQSRSILTQLGAIRMQLQREQLRMDETLRKRGITQSKSVDFH